MPRGYICIDFQGQTRLAFTPLHARAIAIVDRVRDNVARPIISPCGSIAHVAHASIRRFHAVIFAGTFPGTDQGKRLAVNNRLYGRRPRTSASSSTGSYSHARSAVSTNPDGKPLAAKRDACNRLLVYTELPKPFIYSKKRQNPVG